MAQSDDFQVEGKNAKALFTLKVHRGEGMALLAMNWRTGTPPRDFVGFTIDYREPGGERFYTLKNRINFLDDDGKVVKTSRPTTLAPIQKFRWVHFPRNADRTGKFVYRVAPVFMNDQGELSYGEPQQAALALRRETYPGELNVTFTRGFVSSQAFVDRYKTVSKLLPAKAAQGLKFVPTHADADEALSWMGFEARDAILDVLDEAIADAKAEVRVIAYDLSEPGVVARLEQLGQRLKIIIDDAAEHGEKHSGETQSADRLVASAGPLNVKRQHVRKLQHNKTVVVDGPKAQAVVCGSTNYSWRGFFVQANNAVVLRGKAPVARFRKAFDDYWDSGTSAQAFGKTDSAKLTELRLGEIDMQVGFSPYAAANAQLPKIAADIRSAQSCLFYSLAFISQTSQAAPIRQAIKAVSEDESKFVYGISDKKLGGLDLLKPGTSNARPVHPSALAGKSVPEPFKSEPVGGGGNRMHHKFVVIDFDMPTARVYLGSYNFSDAADADNGENLLLIRDRRIATAYAVEALRIFDHYHFRLNQKEAIGKEKRKQLFLAKPPPAGKKPWWDEDYTKPQKIRDRVLFA